MWGKILVKYYGDDFELIDNAKLGWSRIPHFYWNFYVYQYATGIAAADQFSADLSTGQAGAAEKYLAYLKAGGSDYPVTVMKNAGVDMLSGKPINTLLTDFNSTVDEMEKLLVKMGKIKR
jgi:oligoendopeptidase F